VKTVSQKRLTVFVSVVVSELNILPKQYDMLSCHGLFFLRNREIEQNLCNNIFTKLFHEAELSLSRSVNMLSEEGLYKILFIISVFILGTDLSFQLLTSLAYKRVSVRATLHVSENKLRRRFKIDV